jgi:predicted aconitase
MDNAIIYEIAVQLPTQANGDHYWQQRWIENGVQVDTDRFFATIYDVARRMRYDYDYTCDPIGPVVMRYYQVDLDA